MFVIDSYEYLVIGERNMVGKRGFFLIGVCICDFLRSLKD